MKKILNIVLTIMCLLIFVGCGPKYEVSLSDVNVEEYPSISVDVFCEGNELEGLGVYDFEIIEAGVSKVPDEVRDKGDNNYQLIYNSGIENEGEQEVALEVKVHINNKTFTGQGIFVTPALPVWEIAIQEVYTDAYPTVSVKFQLVDTAEVAKPELFELVNEQVLIKESGNFVQVHGLELLEHNEYMLTYTTSYTERLKKEYPFTVELTIGDDVVATDGVMVPPPLENLEIQLEQIDTHSYPNVKLYYSIINQDTGMVPQNLMKDFFTITESTVNGESVARQDIIKVGQLNEQEVLNINLVADISGSMGTNNKIGIAKNTIIDFVETVQFHIGDQVELLAFSDGVYSMVDFTSNPYDVINAVNQLETGDMTCFYDALFAAINRTATQEGAKCIIAFTDGKDNISYNTKDSVIDLANRYGIPIFIIGVGNDLEQASLQQIANSTGGFYRNINNINDMQDIYDMIYRQQKELYVVEYKTDDALDTHMSRVVQLEIQANEVGGRVESVYEPKVLIDVHSQVSSGSAIDDIIGEYLRGFVEGINVNDFSYLAHTIEVGSPLYDTQKKYVETMKVKEELISYEIMERTFDGNGECRVKVREIYQIENFKEPLHIKIFENTYGLRQQPNGEWLLITLDELTVVGKTAN